MAVIDVESGGRLYWQVSDKYLPPIRFKRHYFDRLLSGEKRAEARRQGLASPKVGALQTRAPTPLAMPCWSGR